MKACMDSDTMPPVGDDIMGGPCSYCSYARARTELTLAAIKNTKARDFQILKVKLLTLEDYHMPGFGGLGLVGS